MRRAAAVAGAAVLVAGCIPAGDGYSRDYPPAPPPSPTRQQWRPEPAPEPQRAPPRSRPTPAAEQEVRVLPAPPPAWEARPVAADGQWVNAATYLVRPGDSLRAIAERTGAGSEAIARANNLAAPFVINAGQRLTIPGGRYHLVRAGQTGIAIARAYKVDWARVVTANALAEPYLLRTGQRLLIPETAGETLQQRAARFHLDLDVGDLVTGSQPALASREAPAKPTASSARVLPATTPIAPPARLRSAFQWPVGGKVVKRFGASGASGDRSDGIKIAVPLDTPVLAAADGVVAYAGADVPALGGLVILTHGDGWTSVYGHAGQLLVQRGQAVRKGQIIARSGNSGFADRPELHFELRKGRTPVDPIARLPAR